MSMKKEKWMFKLETFFVNTRSSFGGKDIFEIGNFLLKYVFEKKNSKKNKG